MRLDRRKAHNIDQLFEVDGTPTNATGAVTVTVTRSDGSVLVANAPTTQPAGTTGVYRYALAPQTELNRLTFAYSGTWSGTAQTEVQVHDLVDGHYFTESEARAADPAFTAAAYSDEAIRIARDEVEDAIEAAVLQALGKGVAFVSRYRRIKVNGTATESIDLPDYFVTAIRSAKIAGVALTAPQLVDLVPASGQLTSTLLTWARGLRNVEIAYEHGLAAPPPTIKRASLLLLKSWLPAFKSTGNELSLSNASSVRLEGVGLSFSQSKVTGAGVGIDEVDRLIGTWLAMPAACSTPIA